MLNEAVGAEVNTKPPVLTMTLSSVVIRVLSWKKLNRPITLKDSVAVRVFVKRKAAFREIKRPPVIIQPLVGMERCCQHWGIAM